MEMHAIAIGEEWQAGPYASRDLAEKTLSIIQRMNPAAELVTQEMDPWADEILAGLLPFDIHVDIINGEPVLPAEVRLTWPPASFEGLQIGDNQHREYFVWAKSERAALLKLATLNRATQQPASRKAAAEGF